MGLVNVVLSSHFGKDVSQEASQVGNWLNIFMYCPCRATLGEARDCLWYKGCVFRCYSAELAVVDLHHRSN